MNKYIFVLSILSAGLNAAAFADVPAGLMANDVQPVSCKIQQVTNPMFYGVLYYQVLMNGKIVFASLSKPTPPSSMPESGPSSTDRVAGEALKQAADFMNSMKLAGLCQ